MIGACLRFFEVDLLASASHQASLLLVSMNDVLKEESFPFIPRVNPS